MRVRRVREVVAAGALAVAVTACAGDPDLIVYDSAGPETTTTTVAPAALPTLGVVTTTTTPPSLIGDVGEEWTDATGNLVGMPSECENLSLVTSRDATGELVAAIALQGLFASADGGRSWTRLAPGETAATTNRTRTILFDPDTAGRLWVSGPGAGEGVFRSDDGGATFTALGDPFGAGRLSVDLSDPERRTMLAVVEGQPTVLRSDDGGEVWVDISDTLPYDFGEPRAALVLDPQTYLLGSRNGPLAGVFRSDDAGANWTGTYVGGIAGAPLVRSDGSIAWLLEYGGGVIVSGDGGETWSDHTGGGISWVSESLVELPDGRLATFGEEHVLMSSDEGESWQLIGPALPFRPNGLLYNRHERAFYIWQSQCGIEDNYPILPEAIMRLAFTVPGDEGANPAPAATTAESAVATATATTGTPAPQSTAPQSAPDAPAETGSTAPESTDA